jgi:hypothetical protein
MEELEMARINLAKFRHELQMIKEFGGTREAAELLERRITEQEELIVVYERMLQKSVQAYEAAEAQKTAAAKQAEQDRMTIFERAMKIRTDRLKDELRVRERNISMSQARFEDSIIEAADNIEMAMEDAFAEMILDAENFRDVFIGFLREIEREIVRIFARRLAGQIMDAATSGEGFFGGLIGSIAGHIFGGGGKAQPADTGTPAEVKHAGGLVGTGPFRMMPAAMFARAPRLHAGLAPDEFPAVLQRGETVIPKETTVVPDVEVNVINETGRPMTAAKQDVRIDGQRLITDVVLKDIEQFGPMRQAIQTIK